MPYGNDGLNKGAWNIAASNIGLSGASSEACGGGLPTPRQEPGLGHRTPATGRCLRRKERSTGSSTRLSARMLPRIERRYTQPRLSTARRWPWDGAADTVVKIFSNSVNGFARVFAM